MNISQRIVLMLKAFVHDIFGEDKDDEPVQGFDKDDRSQYFNGLMDAAQSQLDDLRVELAKAIAVQKRIDTARVDAAKHSTREQEDGPAGYPDEDATVLDALSKECALQISGLRAAVDEQQLRLDALRKQHSALADREKNVLMIDELMTIQRSLVRRSDSLHHDFAAWEDEIAQREDRIAARREWNQ